MNFLFGYKTQAIPLLHIQQFFDITCTLTTVEVVHITMKFSWDQTSG